MPEKVLTRNFGLAGSHTLAVYEASGGYRALRKALAMPPQAIIDEVRQAQLRGRGGAGFPAGLKWGFLPKEHERPRYLCVNADEGEPGTFKDRALMELDPHQLIEGIAITCFANAIHKAYIYIRGEFVRPARILEAAIDEAYRAGHLGRDIHGSGFSLEVWVHRGAGAYICGEETALIESLEGKRGQPRLKPPFPAVMGLFAGPTIVNNVETLCNVPHIVERGAAWFMSLGSERNGGTRLYAVSGHVRQPGIHELPMGVGLRELIYDHCGGIRGGRQLKAVIPGGSSTPVLTAAEIDVRLDFDCCTVAGTMAGSGGVIVIDETVCIPRLAARTARFYAHESCGQCTPCREGTPWVHMMLQRIEDGRGRPDYLDLILEACDNMSGTTICPLADACAMPVRAFIRKFRPEFEAHIAGRGCGGRG